MSIKVKKIRYNDGAEIKLPQSDDTKKGNVPKNGLRVKSVTINPEQASARIRMQQDYERKVNQIISDIQRKSKNDGDRISELYRYFVDNIEYWDDYPEGDEAIAGTAPFKYRRENGETATVIIPDYNSKECAILAGYSVCRGISCAFKDILGRMGIESLIVHNRNHQWNMINTPKGPRYFDLSQAVQHFSSVDNISGTTKRRSGMRNRKLFLDNYMVETLQDSYYRHAGGSILNEREER